MKHNFLYRQFDPQAEEATATIVKEIKSLGEVHKTQIDEVKTEVGAIGAQLTEVEKKAQVTSDAFDKFVAEQDEKEAKRAGYTKYALQVSGIEDIPVKAGSDITSGYSRFTQKYQETNMDLMINFHKTFGENLDFPPIDGHWRR